MATSQWRLSIRANDAAMTSQMEHPTTSQWYVAKKSHLYVYRMSQRNAGATSNGNVITTKADATKADPINLDLSVNKLKDSGNTKLNPTSNHNFVSLDLYNTFYNDYFEYKHYINDVTQKYPFK